VTPPTQRLFLALELDPPTHAALVDLSTRLQKGALFTPARFAWVPPENFHLTLFFLGDTPGEKVGSLLEALTHRAAQIQPFQIDVRHLGYFPQAQGEPPRVLWTGIHQPPAALAQTRDACADALRATGLPVPAQDFNPHITLARIKSTRGLREFQTMARTYDFIKCGRSNVESISLFESQTGGGPARHTPIGRAPLALCTG
jgi:2'-5' RNA ligase